ncbi:MAG: ABC-2 family transporter protein [Caldilineaceae bacterium]|nr:ABC-2 family transporter protein [Caldilineaceae bacterium]
MHILRLFAVYLRLGLLGEMEYRANFWINLLQSFLELGVALAGLAVVFDHTDTLGDWKPDELLALVGVYFLIAGMIRSLVRPSMQLFMEDIRKGTLDFKLTKPEDAQLLVSIQRVEIWRLVDAVVGIIVLSIALSRIGAQIGLTDALIFGVTLVAGGLIVYSFFMILATCAFWFVRVENILVIFDSMYQAGRWPVTIYPTWLQWILTFLVPVAFATTVPASALTSRIEAGLLASSVGLAIGLFVAARLFWRYGLRFYSGASA